jgi:membrane-associated phospholipid phosphatase
MFAAAFAAAAALVWAIAFRTAVGAGVDETTLAGFVGLSGSSSRTLATAGAHLGDPVPVALFTVGIVSLALVRRRPRLAVTACLVLAGANVTTQVLKVITADPRTVDSAPGAHIAEQSWPSGHATASMTVALCLIAAAPPRLRPAAAALGGSFALGVSYSVLLLGWHLPSDVLGGFCVAAAWTLSGLAFLWAAEGVRPVPGSKAALAPALVIGLGVAGVVGAVAVARLDTAFGYAEDNTTFVAAAAFIGAGALSMAAALAAALRD